MAKSVRSKVKKRHRSYMRATIGEKVRSANIEAAAERMTVTRNRGGSALSLLAAKGACVNPVDLKRMYYEAVVRPVKESIPVPEKVDEKMETEASVEVQQEQADLASKLCAIVPNKPRRFKGKLSGTGVFSKKRGGPRKQQQRQHTSTKEMVSF